MKVRDERGLEETGVAMMRRRKQRVREEEEAVEREDHRTSRVLARLEASSRRYDRAVERVEVKLKEIKRDDTNRGTA